MSRRGPVQSAFETRARSTVTCMIRRGAKASPIRCSPGDLALELLAKCVVRQKPAREDHADVLDPPFLAREDVAHRCAAVHRRETGHRLQECCLPCSRFSTVHRSRPRPQRQKLSCSVSTTSLGCRHRVACGALVRRMEIPVMRRTLNRMSAAEQGLLHIGSHGITKPMPGSQG